MMSRTMVVDVVTAEELMTLAKAVTLAILLDALNNALALFTVFAPTNKALSRLDPKLLTEFWKDHLKASLLYHMLLMVWLSHLIN